MSRDSPDDPDLTVTGGGIFEQPADDADGPAGIVARVGDELLAIPGVEGVGLTQTRDGGDGIVVFVRDGSVAGLLPDVVGGLPIVVEVTGQIDAQQEP